MQLSDRLSVPLMRAMKRPMNAVRDGRALDVLTMPVQRGSFLELRGKHALLVTYKRDGTPVPSPVWFARDGQRVYVWTEINAFKAKRLRRDSRALLASCTARGVPLGNPVAAKGRILEEEAERRRAASVIRRSWGPWRRLLVRLTRPVTDVHYLEFTPD